MTLFTTDLVRVATDFEIRYMGVCGENEQQNKLQ